MKIVEERAQKVCRGLEASGVYRKIEHTGQAMRVNLASNDYLGVVRRGLLRPSFARHAGRMATGGASSRLIFGTTNAHRALEEKLAAQFGYEAALVFTSGFMANYGLCSALKELADTVLIDKRVHASVVDGLMQGMGGKADVRSFKHNDPSHYRRLAGHISGDGCATITESLFSMTGAVCSGEIIDEAARLGFLIVDEAHSIGACEPSGKLVLGRGHGVDATIGTFGKAFGSLGGFILCSTVLQEFLVNRCRSFIFTTALPESYAAVGADALDLVRGMDEERAKLANLSSYLSAGLRAEEFRTSGGAHILAVYCSGAEAAVEVSRLLHERGIAIYAVRPPTVPPGEVLLRVSLNATLEIDDLDFFIEQLRQIRKSDHRLFGGATCENTGEASVRQPRQVRLQPGS